MAQTADQVRIGALEDGQKSIWEKIEDISEKLNNRLPVWVVAIWGLCTLVIGILGTALAKAIF